MNDEIFKPLLNLFLETNKKEKVSELTTEEIKIEIKEAKEMIALKEVWASSDPLHFDELEIFDKYVEFLENIIAERNKLRKDMDI